MRRKKKGRGLSMQTIRDVLRMGIQCKCGTREIARALGIAHSTVSEYLQAANKASLSIETLNRLADDELMVLIKPRKFLGAQQPERPVRLSSRPG